ncbi:hypothetical protein, conserved in T. vivax [Trypanosoma vivax Y486]|uniref:Uncharacterized protein n=1 Tax=Trypanosoma vivax (strain Y486) TaxID=1055687 RepID=F9WU36_TRYVY|nr:hypothetical protein, conserved in T. vivax [Trypanosoma vivax Y486]|eukprot:CCD21083.1 hypothetical protein, conserved in T. vivax [Trypanosoma vivax Y486]
MLFVVARSASSGVASLTLLMAVSKLALFESSSRMQPYSFAWSARVADVWSLLELDSMRHHLFTLLSVEAVSKASMVSSIGLYNVSARAATSCASASIVACLSAALASARSAARRLCARVRFPLVPGACCAASCVAFASASSMSARLVPLRAPSLPPSAARGSRPLVASASRFIFFSAGNSVHMCSAPPVTTSAPFCADAASAPRSVAASAASAAPIAAQCLMCLPLLSLPRCCRAPFYGLTPSFGPREPLPTCAHEKKRRGAAPRARRRMCVPAATPRVCARLLSSEAKRVASPMPRPPLVPCACEPGAPRCDRKRRRCVPRRWRQGHTRLHAEPVFARALWAGQCGHTAVGASCTRNNANGQASAAPRESAVRKAGTHRPALSAKRAGTASGGHWRRQEDAAVAPRLVSKCGADRGAVSATAVREPGEHVWHGRTGVANGGAERACGVATARAADAVKRGRRSRCKHRKKVERTAMRHAAGAKAQVLSQKREQENWPSARARESAETTGQAMRR